ncbi:Ribonuclease P [Methanosalsum zhilinae DSM 4017]|uniref:Ribonuclease P protein component 3 n=1 Tax=Methanosalsum zhilinae (strain DSM 4017 / NBRC 107636 / OCM 62 / WeN5) TaxID=679901 RepID=F7XML5_METZD|nr:ribonuclease P protein component 3 [Methanosalsum zhilinae]AEH61030.1 Ribonuclease P [Methanosalsum zhilinae DSM 4017]
MNKYKFYECNVHSYPDGTSSVSEITDFAKHLGYSGIVITTHSNNKRADIDMDYEEDELNIYRGIEIVTDSPSKLHGLVGKYRNKVDIISVHGGSEKINRAAVENPNIDYLAHPITPRDSGLNHVLAKAASTNNVAIDFNLDLITKGRGGKRVHSLLHFKNNLNLARKFNVPLILTSNSFSIYDMRAPLEMIALAKLFGMTRDEAMDALSNTPLRMLEKNNKSSFIFEGVEIIN